MADNATANIEYVGYWGDPNSILDFCEPNYAISYYFAEFFNTLSSMPMIFQAILGLILTHRYATKEFRYKLCFMSLMLVGIGSSLFHASLKYHYQLLDELPMLFLSATGTFVTLTLHSNKNNKHHMKRDYYLVVLLVSITLLETYCYCYFKIWSIFFWGYSINVLITTYVLMKYHLKDEKIIKRVFIIAWCCYYGGFVFWGTDMVFCDYVQVFQLHSFWHLAAGYGAYMTFLTCILVRAKYLKKKPDIYILNVSDLISCDNRDDTKCNKQTIIDIPLVHYCKYHDIHHQD